MRFKYRVRTKAGQPLEGFVNAADQADAENILRNRDLIIVELTQSGKAQSLWQKIAALTIRRVKLKSKIFFMRQLAAMLETGIGLDASFDIIIEQERDFKLRAVISEIKNQVKESGGSLSLAMAESFIFDDI